MLLLSLSVAALAASITCHALDVHVAPMVGFTNRHLRSLLRIANPDSTLWTEMIKPAELLAASESRQQSLLSRGADDGACVLQLGGDNADELCDAIRLAEDGGHGYARYDLNCGCPSVHSNAPYGAALMRRPEHVLYLCDRMASAAGRPISIKCRIGVHDTPGSMKDDSLDTLLDFIGTVTESGAVNDIVIHSRAAILSGLSIEKNREVPPLRTDIALAAATAFPHINFVLNGALEPQCAVPDAFVGAMFGRFVIRDPLALLKPPASAATRRNCDDVARKIDIISKYSIYAGRQGLGSLVKGEAAVTVLLPLALAHMAAAESIERDVDTIKHQAPYIRALLSSIVHLLQRSKTSSRDDSKLAELALDVDGCDDMSAAELCGPVGRVLKEAMGKKVYGKIVQVRGGGLTQL